MTDLVTETLPLGEPFAAAIAADQAKLEAAFEAARAALVPQAMRPVSADALAAYATFIARGGAMGFLERAADGHARSVTAWPDLAACFRSPECLDDIATAAAQLAHPMTHTEAFATAQSCASTAARARYLRTIAAQIIAVEGHELGGAARQLLEAEALQARLVAARARHEAHAATELARIEAARRVAAAAIADKTAEKVREAEALARETLVNAQQAAENYRKVKAEAVLARLERLRAAGRQSIRWGQGAEERVFGIDDLISTMRGGSLEQLNRIEIVLERGGA